MIDFLSWFRKPKPIVIEKASVSPISDGMFQPDIAAILRTPKIDIVAAEKRNRAIESIGMWWRMVDAEAHLSGRPIVDNDMVLTFMGSGASHQVTAREMRDAFGRIEEEPK